MTHPIARILLKDGSGKIKIQKPRRARLWCGASYLEGVALIPAEWSEAPS